MSRRRLPALVFVAVALLGPSTLACTGDTETSGALASGGGDDELRSGLRDAVAAVRINGGVVVAAPGKVRRVFDAVGLGPRAARAPEGGLQCPPSFTLEFLDARGVVKATAGFMCGALAAAARKNVAGSVQAGGKSYLVTASDVDALEALAQEPTAIGDALFGVDRAQIAKAGETEVKVTTARTLVAKLVRSIDGDVVPDPYARRARCLPSRAVSFFRGAEQVGSASFSCVDGERGVVEGTFSARDERANGGVAIDAGAVLDVEQAISRP